MERNKHINSTPTHFPTRWKMKGPFFFFFPFSVFSFYSSTSIKSHSRIVASCFGLKKKEIRRMDQFVCVASRERTQHRDLLNLIRYYLYRQTDRQTDRREKGGKSHPLYEKKNQTMPGRFFNHFLFLFD